MQNQIENNTNTESQQNSYAHKDSSLNLEFLIKIEKKRMLLLKPSPNSPLVHPRLTTPSPIFVLLSKQNKTIVETLPST